MPLPPVSTIVEALFHRAEHIPDSYAYMIGEEAETYGRLHHEVLETAAGLAAAGLAAGARCALLLPTGFDFIRALFAAQLVGAIPVPLNPGLPVESLFARLRLVRCDFAIGDPAALAALAADPARQPLALRTVDELRAIGRRIPRGFDLPRPDHPAMLFLTSGTTGEPRAGIRLHRNLLAAAETRLRRLCVRADDVFVGWIPLYHTMGLSHFIAGPLYAGCPAHLVQPAVANLRAWLHTISRTRATVTSGPDFGYRAAAATVDPTEIDLTSLRTATSGSEPVQLATIRQFEQRFGVPGIIRPMYGLSEAGAVTMLGSGEPLRIDDTGRVSCGRPLDGIALQIVDDSGDILPPGAPGEIRLRGQQVFAGYFEDEAATRQTLRDGWLYTGDAGALDDDGHLFVHGRLRSLIKRGGATIAPRELESAAESVRGVLLAAAIGVSRPNSLGTEDIVVVAEVDQEGTTSESRTGMVRAIADSLLRTSGLSPSDVVLVAPGAVPRTANGKVRHDELKRLYANGDLTRP